VVFERAARRGRKATTDIRAWAQPGVRLAGAEPPGVEVVAVATVGAAVVVADADRSERKP
jgi:hypothetical protein